MHLSWGLELFTYLCTEYDPTLHPPCHCSIITIHSLQETWRRGNTNILENTYTRLIETSPAAVKGYIDLLIDL